MEHPAQMLYEEDARTGDVVGEGLLWAWTSSRRLPGLESVVNRSCIERTVQHWPQGFMYPCVIFRVHVPMRRLKELRC